MADPIRVLHVDDERSIAELSVTFLERQDDRLAVDVVTSAGVALEALEDEPYDAVVSDYDMPGMNGLEFLNAVREEYPSLPFVLFTGKGSEQVASEAISAGVTDYLQKQTGTEQYELLANRLLNAVGQSRAETALETQETVLSTVIENLPAGVLVEDDSREILAVNAELLTIFGAEGNPAAYHGCDCAALAEELGGIFEDPAAFRSSIQRCLQARDPVMGEQFELADGRRLERDYVPYDLPTGEANLWVYQDVTDDHERKQLLTGLFEESTDGIAIHEILTDDAGEPIDYVFRAVNDRFEELTGLSRAAIVGERATDVIPGLEETGYIERYGAVALEGATARFESYAEPLDRHYDVSAFAPMEGTFITIFSDITDRIERERELERFEFFVERTPDFMIILNEDLTVRYQSPVSDAIDYEPLQVTGDDPLEYIHPDEREAVVAEFQAVLEDPSMINAHEYRAAVADGGWRWFESRVQNYLDDPPIDGILVTIREITERKRQERHLERQNARLEEFASVVSHDLRNPLAVAMGRLEILDAELDGESEHLEDIAWALDRMEELIEDVLTLARDGRQVGDIFTVDLSTVVAECWSGLETDGATIEYETELRIRADESRLQQLLENLFSNALEHGHAQGAVVASEDGDDLGGPQPITVTVGELRDGSGFYVADDGCGIPADERDRVFEVGVSTDGDGTGFGLAIVSDIAEAHGWTVRLLESEQGGARFEFDDVEVVD